MKITRDEVIHVAHLARLDMDPGSVDKFAGQVGKILEYVDTLNRLDTADIAPTAHAISLTNAFREDRETESLPNDAATANAPDPEDGCFLVPKIIE